LPPNATARLKLDREGRAVCCVAVSADGKRIAAAQAGSNIVLVKEIETGRIHHRLVHRISTRLTCLAFSPSGKVLAVGGKAGMLFLHDLARGKQMASVQAHPSATWTLAFTPDGKTLATGGDEASVRLWDARNAKPVREMRGDNRDHRVVSFSPDGKLLAAAGEGRELTLWDSATGDVVRDCSGLPGEIGFAAFTGDGRQIVLAARQSIIRIHDVASGDEIASYGDDKVRFNAFALVPNGRTLVTAGKDGTVQLWDLASSHRLMSIKAHPRETTALALSPDGKVLVSGGAEGNVMVWRLPNLLPAQLRMLWQLLGSDHPNEVKLAEEGLCRADALPFLRKRITEVLRGTADIPRLLAELDADDFATRERATEILTRQGRVVRAALERLLSNKPNLEVSRRAQRILRHLADVPDEERSALRAIGAVEKLSDPEAGKLIEWLARSKVTTPLVREARAALQRWEAAHKR
jgi:dipeptidyl aminopeptidase/acylaminoacyl peptidase